MMKIQSKHEYDEDVSMFSTFERAKHNLGMNKAPLYHNLGMFVVENAYLKRQCLLRCVPRDVVKNFLRWIVSESS